MELIKSLLFTIIILDDQSDIIFAYLELIVLIINTLSTESIGIQKHQYLNYMKKAYVSNQ